MNISRSVAVAFLVAAAVLFAGMLFWPFILNNIIEPTALVVWLLLRILVLSVDQKYIWYAVILTAAIFLFRIPPRNQPSTQPDVFPETNATINRIEYWHIRFTYIDQNAHDEKNLKQELIRLLTTLYASKQGASNHFGIYEALQQGEIPLPGNIHAYLFPQEPQKPSGLTRKVFQFFRTTPRKWIYHWSGQAKAERERMVNEVLNLLETSLEIKNDD